MAQRAFSHSWVSSLPEALASDMFTQGTHCPQFSTENISCTTEIGSAAIQFCSNNELQQASAACFSAFDIPSYKPINIPTLSKPSIFPLSNEDLPNGFTFSSLEASGPTKCTVDTSSMFLNPALIGHMSNASESIGSQGAQQQQFSGFSISMPQEMQENMGTGEDEAAGLIRKNSNDEWGTIRSIGFPFSLPSNETNWKPNLPWDSPPCPSEMSTSYSTNTCYT